MGKIAFGLGVVGSVIVGILASSRLVSRDYSGSIVNKLGNHPCPTFWVSWDKPPDLVPPGTLTCGCPEQAKAEAGGTPIHPPKEMHDAAGPMDGLTLSYTEFTSFGGTKHVGASYVLRRGNDSQTFVVSPAFGPYSAFAMAAATPFVLGIVVAIVLGLIPKKKGAID
jgi:hypothetical protein